WDWYAGADASGVGGAQYDFQTVVTHEIGHALGLGHSQDTTSVMNATLTAGQTKRLLTTSDLNLQDSDGGQPSGLHAAQPTAPPLTSSPSATVPTTMLVVVPPVGPGPASLQITVGVPRLGSPTGQAAGSIVVGDGLRQQLNVTSLPPLLFS